MKEKPKYYTVLTPVIRYDKNLTSLSKLIYSEIELLSTEKGYCYANNKYFAEAYGVAKVTVSRSISELVNNKYLSIELIKENKKIKERRLRISTTLLSKMIIPYNQKRSYPIIKNDKENSINKNNINKNIVLDAEAPKDFEKFWNLYGRKINKSKSLEIWNELTTEDKEKIFTHLPNYINSTPDIKYRLHPTTYLNRRNWNIQLDTYLSDSEIGKDNDFITAWKQWIKHKQQSTDPYKSKDQELIELNLLKTHSRDNELKKKDIIFKINSAIAKNYKGIIY